MAVTPVIEAADCTVSGSNTASSSWSVSFPAAAFGDLLIVNLAWDDSTAVTSVTAPAGPRGETAVPIEGPVASASTEVRGQSWYYVAAGAWTAGSLTFTPSASESRSATVIRVQAGEFDAVAPIGANSSAASTGTAETAVLSPAFSAGASDGDGCLVWFGFVDADPLSATNPTGWTIRQRQDLGDVAHGIATRDSAVTNSESITAGSWAITSDSWASIAYVVRAPVVGAVTLAPSSDAIAVNEWTDLTATVEYASAPVAGMGVTAASDDTAVAVAVVGTGQIETTPSGTWGVTHSSPGGTSPLGATLTRATEDSSTTFHEGYWTGTDLALGAASKAIFAAVEIKKPVGRDYVKLVLDDGVGGGGITFNCATGAVASTLTSLGAIEYGARDLGSNWWVLWVRCTTTSTNEVIVAVGANNDSFSSYVGDGATYCDIGRVWTMWPDVTDASGEITVRVIGRDAGSADITATSLADTSGASTITVGVYESASDSAAASESVGTTLILAPAVADSGAGTDSATTALAATDAVSDSAAATDTVAAFLTVAESASDSGAATDSATAGLAANDAASDTAAGTDAAVAGLSAAASAADSADATDSATAGLSAAESASDSAAGTDAATGVLTVAESASDTSDATDDAAGAITAAVAVADSAEVTDAASQTITVAVAVTDTADAADVTTDDLAGGAVYNESAADAADASETAVAALIASDAVTDAADASDAATASVVAAVAVADAVDATDSAAATAALYELLADAVAIDDVAAAALALALAVADAADASDLVVTGFVESVSDSCSAQDAVGSAAVLAEVLTDIAAGSEILLVYGGSYVRPSTGKRTAGRQQHDGARSNTQTATRSNGQTGGRTNEQHATRSNTQSARRSNH